jgi:FkbM family methyltransferase
MTNPYQEVFAQIGRDRAYQPPMSLSLRELGHAGLFFSLAGEDALLRQVMKQRLFKREPGVFVDIGCNFPASISNSYLFYCYGWRGLCVDADSDLAPDWKLVRPEDAFVASAVGEQPGLAFLVKHRTNSGMHFIQEDASSRGPDFLPARSVPVRRLDDLLDEHIGAKPIDFMSIDVEGSELGVLSSNDWTRWTPNVIIMECHDFEFARPYAAPTVAYLQERGYHITAVLGGNVVMKLSTSAP